MISPDRRSSPNALPSSRYHGLFTVRGEHPDQQRIRSFGGRGVLCAPTAHQTNGLIGVSPENKSPRNLESIIGRVRPGNYRRNYSRFQKNSTKNSSESRARAPLPERRFPTTLDCQPSTIYGQFMILICRVPPPSEGTVKVSSLRWHTLGDDGGGTTLGGG